MGNKCPNVRYNYHTTGLKGYVTPFSVKRLSANRSNLSQHLRNVSTDDYRDIKIIAESKIITRLEYKSDIIQSIITKLLS